MPALGIHLLVGDEVKQKLKSATDPMLNRFGQAASSHPEMMALGSIGADLLYYTAPEIGTTFSYLLSKIINDGFSAIAGLLSQSARILEETNQTALAELATQFAGLTKIAFANITADLERWIIDLNNQVLQNGLLYVLSAEQLRKPEDKWNWGDILHDRLVGEFAGRLMDQALQANNAAAVAYAVGYYTHIATDTTGHPFVNAAAGGPARGWDLRHTLAEKFMDAGVYFRLGQNINSSSLHKRFDSLKGSSDFDVLAGIVAGASAYFSANLPGFPLPKAFDKGDLHDGLRNMCELFELVTTNSFTPPPKAPAVHLPPLPGQAGSITNALGGLLPHGHPPRSITDWLKMLLFFLAAGPAVMTDICNFVVQVALTPALYPLEGAMYMLQVLLYQTYRQTRYFLVTSGVLFPLEDEMGDPFAQQFTRSLQSSGDDRYPHVPPDKPVTSVVYNGIALNSQDLSAMSYPSSAPIEHPIVRASLYPAGQLPEYFIRELQLDPQFMVDWERVSDPSELRRFVSSARVTGAPPTGGFGNSVDFSLYLLKNPHFADRLNTDSDRGYGYKRWTCDGGLDTGNLVNERFI